MTTILKEETIVANNGETYFVEKYQDKEAKTPFWRYGVILNSGYPFIIRHSLRSKPRLKKYLEKLNLI